MNNKRKTLIKILSLFFLSLFWLILFCGFVISLTLFNRFYPGTTISGVGVGGKTKEEVQKLLLNRNWEYLKETNIGLLFKEEILDLKVKNISPSFKTKKTIEEVFEKSHGHSLKNTLAPLKSILGLSQWKQKVFIKKEGVLAEKFNQFLKNNQVKPKNAKLEIINANIYFTEAEYGEGFDRDGAKRRILTEISQHRDNQIELRAVKLPPEINDVDLAQAYFLASSLIQNKGFSILRSNQTIYRVDSEDLLDWMEFNQLTHINNEEVDGKIAGVSTSTKDQAGISYLPLILKEESKLEASINQERVGEFADSIANRYNFAAKNATLTIRGGQVVVLERGRYGQKVDKEKLLSSIWENIRTASGADIELPIETIVPEIRSDNVHELGIKELVAKGESNFSGSSENRIHNLKLGASKFDNHIISPNETLSFSKVIDSVEASDGYLPELVIKGKKTIQEYGGGMCQVSTTAYRGALLSGFPIVERHPHAYLVGYYKDGPDATVYVPYTDLKFKNDTGHYVLIQTYTVGKKLVFEFWGTNPGRTVKLSLPHFFDPIPAPVEPYYIDDPSYPQGYEKQEEGAHEGISSIITRTIAYTDGKIEEESIKSTYKPWPAKIRRGTGPPDLPIPEEEDDEN